MGRCGPARRPRATRPAARLSRHLILPPGAVAVDGRQPPVVVSAGRVLAGRSPARSARSRPRVRLYRTHSRSVSALTKMKKTWPSSSILRDGVSSNIGSMAKRLAGRARATRLILRALSRGGRSGRGLAVKGRFAVVDDPLCPCGIRPSLALGLLAEVDGLALDAVDHDVQAGWWVGPAAWLRRGWPSTTSVTSTICESAPLRCCSVDSSTTASDRSSRKRSSRRILRSAYCLTESGTSMFLP